MASAQEIKRFIDDSKKDGPVKSKMEELGHDLEAIVAYANGAGYAFTMDDLDKCAASKNSKQGYSHEELKPFIIKCIG